MCLHLNPKLLLSNDPAAMTPHQSSRSRTRSSVNYLTPVQQNPRNGVERAPPATELLSILDEALSPSQPLLEREKMAAERIITEFRDIFIKVQRVIQLTSPAMPFVFSFHLEDLTYLTRPSTPVTLL
jgi:hypothetical protein